MGVKIDYWRKRLGPGYKDHFVYVVEPSMALMMASAPKDLRQMMLESLVDYLTIKAYEYGYEKFVAVAPVGDPVLFQAEVAVCKEHNCQCKGHHSHN